MLAVGICLNPDSKWQRMSETEPARQNGSTNAYTRHYESRRWYPKTHANYWKARLEHRSYSRDDRNFEVAEWSVRIYF